MLIDWVVGRDCRNDIEKQAEEIGHARRSARDDIEKLREVSLDLTDASALVGDACRHTILRMTERFGVEVTRRISDVFGPIIEQLKSSHQK